MSTINRTHVVFPMVVAVCFALLLPHSRVSAEDHASFQYVVDKNFDRWTENDHGVLSVEKVNQLILRTDVRGAEAAALASIHAFQRKSGTGERLTRENLHTKSVEDPTLRRDQAASRRQLDRNHRGFLQHIQSAPRRLFAVERPSLDTVTQGKLGDCYFVSAVGALAHSDPDRILRMITQKPDRSFEVRFLNGKHVTVAALSDAQLALSSNAGQQGVWLNVLEIAAGIVRSDSRTQQLPLDIIGSGGKSAFSIGLLTGHDADQHRISNENQRQISSP